MSAERCYRCGEPAPIHSWNICSLPGVHPVCTSCDVALNGLVLAFMNVPDSARRLRRYAKKMSAIRGIDAGGEGEI